MESAPNGRPVFMQFVLQPRVVGNSVRGCTVTLANETTERSSLLTNTWKATSKLAQTRETLSRAVDRARKFAPVPRLIKERLFSFPSSWRAGNLFFPLPSFFLILVRDIFSLFLFSPLLFLLLFEESLKPILANRLIKNGHVLHVSTSFLIILPFSPLVSLSLSLFQES